jgi:membrane associated rhomboid family serine protease
MTGAAVVRAVAPTLAAWLVVVGLLIGHARAGPDRPSGSNRIPRIAWTLAGGWALFDVILVVFYRGLGFASWGDVGQGVIEGAVLAFVVAPAGFLLLSGMALLSRRLRR